MLDNKAKPRRLNSKGNLSIYFRELCLDTKFSKVGRALSNSIPVLSIFALMGIAICSFVCVDKLANSSSMANFANFILSSESNKAYAEEGITPLADTSASLTVDDGKIKDTIFATSGEFAYASHKVNVAATNIKSYTLTLSKTTGLTGPSTVNDANAVNANDMDNQWGYAWIDETTNPKDDTVKYYAVTDSTTVANNDNIDSSHNVDYSKQLVFGAKFGSSTMSGTYHAEATLSLVATPYVVVNYSLAYHANNGTGAPTTQTYADDTGAASHTFTISSTVPTRSGYKFLGWAESSTATTAQYAANGSITLPATAPTKTIYAVWQQVLTIKTITNMQQMTKDVCAASATGDTNTLTDTRDNSTYTVAKLSDGNCWMTQNLRIVGKKIYGAGVDGYEQDSDIVSGSFQVPASGTKFTSDITNKAAYYNNDTTRGAYYTWCSATAGTCTDAITNGANAISSICPKGWKLPVSGTGTTGINTGATTDQRNDFMTLAEKTSTEMFLNTSTSIGGTTFPYAGYIATGGSQTVVGSRGFYWSRTASGTEGVYYLDVYEDPLYVVPAQNQKYRHFGFNIRCIAYSN